MTYYHEPFDYPDGDLNGNAGWSGSTAFQVIDDYVACGTSGAQTIKTSVTIEDLDTFTVTGFLGSATYYGDRYIEILNAANQLVCGIGLEMYANNHLLQIFNGYTTYWDEVVNIWQLTDGTLYPFAFKYSLADNKYLSIVFNGVDYGESIVQAAGARPITQLQLVENSSIAHTGLFDDITFNPPSNKYFKFPKWQKTKMGMRPWY